MKTIEQLLEKQRHPRGRFITTNQDLSPHAVMAKRIDEGLKEVERKTLVTFTKAQELNNKEKGVGGSVEFFQ